MWKERVDPELVDMFLDRLFQECKNSICDFERILADYGMENIKVFPLTIEDDDCTEDCPHLKELDDKILKLNNLIKEAKDDSARNHQLYLDEREKYKKLKKNSVVFTMEDMEF